MIVFTYHFWDNGGRSPLYDQTAWVFNASALLKIGCTRASKLFCFHPMIRLYNLTSQLWLEMGVFLKPNSDVGSAYQKSIFSSSCDIDIVFCSSSFFQNTGNWSRLGIF